ncbi:TPA: hypothetical protein KRE09_002200 [Clostridioides difficile]|uniref:BRO-N domain-containing protein n=1 Tax=Clostridioides difficile TaxID=1496 RepID=UPI0009A46228|nr:BRO family protein [Clostridioides difficile]AUO78237.1 prophage antirepressor [Clostridioides phage LIBA6276]AUO78409.1 prophage antirepressor [Clostridioides phage LIBA2945]EGT4117143.1 hypothetical protein [Clostridioides difficile]EGT5282706.1 hypothetical protein [Clostridioides difficile]MBG0082232.1 hypothetical protein [Clostridioides difficile]
MGNLMVFEGKEVEVFEFEGKILFNPKHVAECLEISDVNSSIRKFNDNQVVKLTNSDMHNMHIRKLNNAGEKFLTESGVYKLIFKSKKKEAEKFQDWVMDEVLPSIRKTGTYNINQNYLLEMIQGGIMGGLKSVAQYVDDRFNGIEESNNRKINEIESLIGLRAKNVTMLSKLLKLKLSYIRGYNVKANDYDYKATTTKIFFRYNVNKWEDIPASKFNEVYDIINNLENIDDVYTWKN